MAALEVEVIPFAETNYAYLIMDSASENCAVVDPGEAGVIAYALARHRRKLTHILNTHYHSDHTGGNLTLKTAYRAAVYASNISSHIAGLDVHLHDGGHFDIFGHTVNVYATPGHTLDSLCFEVEGNLFTGDTLFAMGSGKLFEGSAHTMLRSLKKILALPDATRIWPGHEYTEPDGKFALSVEPENAVVRKRLSAGAKVPFTLEEEKASNPFLRTSVLSLRTNLHMENAREDQVLADLRMRKDRF